MHIFSPLCNNAQSVLDHGYLLNPLGRRLGSASNCKNTNGDVIVYGSAKTQLLNTVGGIRAGVRHWRPGDRSGLRGGNSAPRCHWKSILNSIPIIGDIVDNTQFGENATLGRVQFFCDFFSELSEGCRISGATDLPSKGTHTFETHGTKVLLLNKAVYVTEKKMFHWEQFFFYTSLLHCSLLI